MEKSNKKEELRDYHRKINNLFEEYYKNTLQMSPTEYDEFFCSLTKKLPVTFRVNKIYNNCEFLDCELQRLILKLEMTDEYKKFNWNGLDNIYQLGCLEKVSHKELKDLLVRENDFGILRQELVSMIPVSLVDISEDSVVIDMCAAPGNKSVQILEIMQEKARQMGVMASGVLISNELDYKRAGKLVHFLQSQPTINVVSTLCPAQEFPKIQDENLQPDFVFCDVPCSGDGTLRKNKGLRKRWRPDYGFTNHLLQIQILENSIRVCKTGGYIIYSTCAINPIENEAVVAHVLEKYNNLVELVDVTSKIKNNLQINFSEGLVKWKVAFDWKDPQNIHYAYDYSQVVKNKHLVKESMFHEVYTKKNHQNNIYYSDPLNIRRCIRFYSHQNNSGCFFVAVLRKKTDFTENEKSPINSTMNFTIPLNKTESKFKTIGDEIEEMMEYLGTEGKNKKDELLDTSSLTASKSENKFSKNLNPEENLIRFDKFVKFKDYGAKYETLKEFYNLNNEDLISQQLHTLRSTSSKILLFSTKLRDVSKILSEMNLTIMHAGLVCFSKERGDLDDRYRLSHYGGIILEPYIQNQKLELEPEEHNRQFFLQLLSQNKIRYGEIKTDLIRDKIISFKKGSLMIIYESVILVCRKGENNLSIMIPEAQLVNLNIYVNKYLY